MRSTPGARAPRPPDQDEAEKIILARAEKILGRKITTAEINRLRDGTLRLHGTELREYDRRGRRIAAHTAEDSAAVWQTTDRDPDTPTSGRAVLGEHARSHPGCTPTSARTTRAPSQHPHGREPRGLRRRPK